MTRPADAWSAHDYAQDARFVSDLGAQALAKLAPKPHERILDIGCGDGALTLKIAQAGANVIGVDASQSMVDAAKAAGLHAVQALAHEIAFSAEFDAVFSNAALHWAPKQQETLAAAYKALRPGGRFVAEMGGRGNIAALQTALRAAFAQHVGHELDLSEIWCFPSVEDQRARLEACGFEDTELELIARPTFVEAGPRAWLSTLAAPVLDKAPTNLRAAVLERAASLAAPALTDRSGAFYADYVRLRFSAQKPAA